MIQAVETSTKKARVQFPNITFSEDDPIPEHCTGDNPLIITEDVGTTPGMMKLGAVASTLYILLKFETQGGIAFVRGKRFQMHVCGQVSRKRDHPEEERDTEGIEHIIVNDTYPEQPLQIAANLSKMLKEKLHELLCHNKDIFACEPTYMTGIPRELAEHMLASKY
ncbi:hypothetical protein Tco_0917594 [Tanacetum coccineum]